MARYFEAPVVQRADYAFQYPIEPIYDVLQLEQKKQDAGLADAMKLYDVNKQDVIRYEGDATKRDALMSQYNKQVDDIIYDANGNVKDLRNVMGQVQTIARQRAAEAQTGGLIHALTTNLSTQVANDKEIDDLAAKGEKGGIVRDHAEWAKQKAREDYAAQQGVGAKNASGFYNAYTPVSPALYKNVRETGDEIAKGWLTDKFQQGDMNSVGGSVDKDGNFIPGSGGKFAPSNEYRAYLQSMYPDYVTVDKNLGTIQTGSLEVAALEDIYQGVVSGLTNDTSQMQYLREEAQWKGNAKTEEEIQAYVDDAVHNAAELAADKHSKMHFDSKTLENWKVKANYNHSLRLREIEASKPKESPINVIESSGQNITYTVKPEEHIKKYDNAVSGRNEEQKLLDNLLRDAKGNTIRYEDLPADKKVEYQVIQDRIQNYNSQIAALGQAVTAAHDKIPDENKPVVPISNAIAGGLLPETSPTDPTFIATRNKVGLWLMQQYPNQSELADLVKSGATIPGLADFISNMDATAGGYIKQERERIKNLNTAVNPTGLLSGSTSLSASENAAKGVFDFTHAISYNDGQLKKALNQINAEGGVTMQTQDPFFSSETKGVGAQGEVNRFVADLNTHVKEGSQDLFTSMADGSDFINVGDYAVNKLNQGYSFKDINQNSISTKPSRGVSPRGHKLYQTTFTTTDGKSWTIQLEQKRTANKNLDQRRAQLGVQMLIAADPNVSIDVQNETKARGAEILGTEDWGYGFADAGVNGLKSGEEAIKSGKTQAVVVHKNGYPSLQVSRLKTGNYIVSLAQPQGYIIAPEDLLLDGDQSNRVIRDTRPWAQKEGKDPAMVFDDLNAVYEALGWWGRNAHINGTADLYKGQTTGVNIGSQYVPNED